MLEKIANSIILSLIIGFVCFPLPEADEPEPETVIRETIVEMEEVAGVPNVIVHEPQLLYEEPTVSEEEINLLALVTMAEAEGESEYGKRLVISTILNRVDHEKFPDTITEVIYQPNQFSSMWNGRVDRCYVMEEIVELVKEELESRTNYDTIFFHAGKYGKYGTPMFQEGNHYFASY